jgi:hypothetical protein
MAKRNLLVLLSTFVLAAAFAGTSPSAAHDNECAEIQSDAVVTLPSQLRKWAQLAWTHYGEALGSRDGWTWASLDDAGKVTITAGEPPHGPDDCGGASFFTAIKMDELRDDELAVTLATFRSGLKIRETGSAVYRVQLTIASGGVAGLLFFDFGTFAGGMWCPQNGCAPESRFLIMQQENKAQITAAFDPGRAPRGLHAIRAPS